jgi:parallel beta-helix repeat protein
MGRKVIAIWLSLAMVFNFIVVLDVIIDFTPPVKGGTIRYVNETGSGGAYKKIQDAINASSDGDTVFVYNGTYFENVVVNKTINLTGENRDSTIIDGGGNGHVIFVNASWVNITGFTVNNSGSGHPNSGMYLSSFSSKNIIKENKIINNRVGIYLSSSSNNSIINNFVSLNSECGILLGPSSYSNITNNNVSSNFWTGISLSWSYNNTVYNNGMLDNWYGIELASAQNNTILYNLIKDSNGAGMYIFQSSINNNINYNNVSFNSKGIYLKDSSKNQIRGNKLRNNMEGIYISRSSNNTVKNNTVISNLNDGIFLTLASNDNIIIRNSIKNNDHGIRIIESTNTNITDNLIDTNEYDGIYIYSSLGSNITGNTISLNQENGIKLESSLSINITNNVITSNWYDGLDFSLTSNSIIMNNNISYNQRGINFYSSIKNILKNNSILWNSNEGIFFSSSSNNSITNNNVSSNYDIGIYLIVFSNNNTIANNILMFNRYRNIYIGSSSNNRIIGNYFLNNLGGIYLSSSSFNCIMDNEFINAGIYIYGEQLSHFNTHIIPENNTVNDEPLYYYKDSYDINIEGISVGEIILVNCSNITLKFLRINNTDVGIEIAYSTEVNIITNSLSSNIYGISFVSSSNNSIYHNNIIANVIQAYDDRDDNYWDNGYPSGGNFWSDYSGIDQFNGPNQDIPGNDGIGDSNYSIDSDSKDNYPLMSPIGNCTFLYNGWNLISLPFIQSDTNLDRVLSSINGYYDSIQWYNNTDTFDHWKHHHISKPFELNDLKSIDHKVGFWIHIIKPNGILFEYLGTPPTSNITIQLYPGWNLVGYPSLTNYNRTEALNNLTFNTHIDAILTYNAATHKWKKLGPSDYFEIGKGYWIHTKTKCEWEVPL